MAKNNGAGRWKNRGQPPTNKKANRLWRLEGEIEDTIKAGGDPVKAAEQLEKGKPSNKLKITRNRDPVLVAAEEWKKKNPNKTLAEYRKLNPDVPPLKIKSSRNQPLQISYKKAGTTNAEKLRQRLQIQSPGIDAAEKAKRKKLFDLLEHMKFVDPEGGWNLEHVERVKDFDAEKYGLGHQAHDLPNLKIQSGKDAKLKTAAEALGDKWNSWNASVYHDDVILYNRSSYDPNFPERAIPVKESDLKAHKKFLETGSLKGATPENKKVIQFLLSERASKDLPIEKQRLAFLKSAAQDKGVSKTTSTLAKKLSAVNGAVENGVNGVNGTKDYVEKLAISKVGKGSKTLGRVGRVLLPSALGAGAAVLSGMDVKAREAKANGSGKWIDKLQHNIAKAELATDIAGAVPGPQSLITEPINLAAGLSNLFIDGVRGYKPNSKTSLKDRKRAVDSLKFIK